MYQLDVSFLQYVKILLTMRSGFPDLLQNIEDDMVEEILLNYALTKKQFIKLFDALESNTSVQTLIITGRQPELNEEIAKRVASVIYKHKKIQNVDFQMNHEASDQNESNCTRLNCRRRYALNVTCFHIEHYLPNA